MASDSQATEGSGGIRYPIQKIFSLSSTALFGCAGLGQIARDIAKRAKDDRELLDSTPDMRESLGSIVRDNLKSHYGGFLNPPGMQLASPATSTLACGYDVKGVPYILEVDEHGTCSEYAERGFHTIGSAAAFAQLANALMAHFEIGDRPLTHGKLVAYRVMDIAVRTAAQGVGKPIVMWTVEPTGARRLDDDEMREIGAHVGGWQEQERVLLDKVLQGPEEDIEVKLPEEADSS